MSSPAVTVHAAHWTEQRKCLHNRRALVRIVIANGGEQVRKGCLECGYTAMPALPFRDHPERAGYPLVVRHPSPCDCHDDRPEVAHHRWEPIDYDAYLNSEQWQERRVYFIQRAMGRCQLCNQPGGPGGRGLHLHHRTYVRLGAELDVDVVVLCQTCHQLHHHGHAA